MSGREVDDNYDELIDFLDHMAFVLPNLNDTFAYACADTEKLLMDDSPDESYPITNISVLVDVFRLFGHTGIIAYVANIRGMNPIKELRTKKYWEAKEYIDNLNWEYDGS